MGETGKIGKLTMMNQDEKTSTSTSMECENSELLLKSKICSQENEMLEQDAWFCACVSVTHDDDRRDESARNLNLAGSSLHE